jgi:adenine/guanine phosphoribosyltransferase-like PRPP-binding protein
MTRHFTEPTTGYWQRIVSPAVVDRLEAPWQFGYPARLPDGRVLVLPIRQLAGDPKRAVASLLINHASLDVADTLGALLAERLVPLEPELVIGLPTLGLTLACVVARALGHGRYLPLGYSRKFWYEEALSAPVHSITSPAPGKRIYLDPNLRPLLEGRRLLLVDDAVSTGTTLAAAWDLIESLGGDVVACGVAMLQGERWRARLGPGRAARVVGVFESPLLKAAPDGWLPALE